MLCLREKHLLLLLFQISRYDSGPYNLHFLVISKQKGHQSSPFPRTFAMLVCKKRSTFSPGLSLTGRGVLQNVLVTVVYTHGGVVGLI